MAQLLSATGQWTRADFQPDKEMAAQAERPKIPDADSNQYLERLATVHAEARTAGWVVSGTDSVDAFFGPRLRATSTRTRSSSSAAVAAPFGRKTSARPARS